MTERWERVADLEDVDWPDEAVLICDEAVVSSAPRALRDRLISVQGGEELKRLSAIETLAEDVLAVRSTRPLTIIAMGGGSVGDAVGFLASILWRGVELWHVPTTLVAAVDSAHGGKTAVNLGSAKNQLGTFWPASRIVCSDAVLSTLSPRLRAEGLVELVKALWLGAAPSLAQLDNVGTASLVTAPWADVADVMGALLDAAVVVKQRIVAKDPRETRGIRTWLNLGHTAAHGLELHSGMSHGVAVAWGIAAAAQLSAQRGWLSRSELERLFGHIYPLLGGTAPEWVDDRFLSAVGQDKKRVRGRLRSVLLKGPGEPLVVDDVAAEDWLRALVEVREELFERPVRVDGRHLRAASLRLAASKSELNRALVISALRGADPDFSLDSEAEDVRAMRAGIASLRRGEIADAKNGGTTFRFLTAIAVSAPTGGRIRVGAQLAARPHEPLFDALRTAGVTIVRNDDVIELGPLPPTAERIVVDASISSQFASAVTLLKAAHPTLEVDIDGDVASPGYLTMTQRMLAIDPLDVTADASSAAMWHVINRLGGTIALETQPGPLQPDSALPALLWEPDATEVHLDMGATPDLVPVLAAYAALTEPEVVLGGASHLRFKESNRIEGLVAAFGAVGVTVQARDDGVRIAAGVQRPTAGALFDPRGDHRLAFAAIVLSTACELVLLEPRCVAKSYPNVFRDAQIAGFEVNPVSDTRGQFPDT